MALTIVLAKRNGSRPVVGISEMSDWNDMIRKMITKDNEIGECA